MTSSSGTGIQPSALHPAAVIALTVALLASGFTGRAGVQVVDGAMAARLFALHLHGVDGEAEYVREFGEAAPFVHPHCHAPLAPVSAQPSPDGVQAASALAGALWCNDGAVMHIPPPVVVVDGPIDVVAPPAALVLPPFQPPR
jgi:hypothetical protein